MHSNWHHTIQSFHITTQKKKFSGADQSVWLKNPHTLFNLHLRRFYSDIWHSREKKILREGKWVSGVGPTRRDSAARFPGNKQKI